MTTEFEKDGRVLTDQEVKARKRRNLWLALALVGFVFLVMAITIVRLQGFSVATDGGY